VFKRYCFYLLFYRCPARISTGIHTSFSDVFRSSFTSKVAQAVTLLTSIRKLSSSNLDVTLIILSEDSYEFPKPLQAYAVKKIKLSL
jgi:hypothetical protein